MGGGGGGVAAVGHTKVTATEGPGTLADEAGGGAASAARGPPADWSRWDSWEGNARARRGPSSEECAVRDKLLEESSACACVFKKP